MDSNCIAILQDYQSSIDIAFNKIEKYIKDYEGSDQSQQNLIVNNATKELSNAKTNLGLMKMEISNLKEQGNTSKWNQMISELQSKHDSYKSLIKNIKNKKNNAGGGDDYLNVDEKVNLNQMSSQQVMDRGDAILNADREAINRMKKVVNKDLDTMKDVNKELLSQNEKLDNANKELKEIDYSLNRAGKQIKTMAKMYATDKLIMCMILCIILVIIAIVIVSFFFDGGEEEANGKTDSFNNGDKSNSANYFNKWNICVALGMILCSYLF